MYPADRDLNKLDPDAKEVIERFMKALERARLDFRVWEAVRSQQRQDYLYAQGRTRDLQLPKVTWTKNSRHTKGRAVDFIHVKSYWKTGLSEDRKVVLDRGLLGEWLAFGRIAKQHGLVWGGDWNVKDGQILGFDPYHVELPAR